MRVLRDTAGGEARARRSRILPGALAVGLAVGLAAVACARPARAHGLEPALLVLREIGPGAFQVTWKSAAQRLPGAEVRPDLPAECRSTSPIEAEDGGDRVRLRWTVDCGPEGLAGRDVGVRDLDVAKITALLRIELRDGTSRQTVLNEATPVYRVPVRPQPLDAFRDYLRLGVEHILSGPDHLLFVAGLLLLSTGAGPLLRTVTGFTVGHSVTLSAAVLGLVRVPSRAIEVLIAASILALAVELARRPVRGASGAWIRVPWLVAAGFGLLHGFGFAGALTEAGLPADGIPAALLAFNVGIEIGQIAFVTALLALGGLLARAGLASGGARRAVVWSMGVLAAFWCFERIALLLG